MWATDIAWWNSCQVLLALNPSNLFKVSTWPTDSQPFNSRCFPASEKTSDSQVSKTDPKSNIPCKCFQPSQVEKTFKPTFFLWSNHFISHHWNPPHHGEFIDMSDIQRLSCNIFFWASYNHSHRFPKAFPTPTFTWFRQRNMVSCSCCSCSFSGAASKVASIWKSVWKSWLLW